MGSQNRGAYNGVPQTSKFSPYLCLLTQLTYQCLNFKLFLRMGSCAGGTSILYTQNGARTQPQKKFKVCFVRKPTKQVKFEQFKLYI